MLFMHLISSVNSIGECDGVLKEDEEDLPSTVPQARARLGYKICIKFNYSASSYIMQIYHRKRIDQSQSILGVFTVLGTTGNPHAIKLFPTESCTCPSTTRCYHIIAVRMSIGLEDTHSNRKINLTQLRRNTRGRMEKKSCRKAPRPGDYTIVAAPDASISVKV